MPSPKHIEQIEALSELIKHEIKHNPIERGGVKWAVRNQNWYCVQLGVSVSTFRRLISKAPFVREQASIDGLKLCLLRICDTHEPATKTPQHLANIMRKIWIQTVGKPVSGKQHGCLIGLAKVWPEGFQIEIFKTALKDWPAYMVGVKFVQDKMMNNGQNVVFRFYKYPSIQVMRRFPEVGVELLGMKLQEAGMPLSAALEAAYMSQHIGG